MRAQREREKLGRANITSQQLPLPSSALPLCSSIKLVPVVEEYQARFDKRKKFRQLGRLPSARRQVNARL